MRAAMRVRPSSLLLALMAVAPHAYATAVRAMLRRNARELAAGNTRPLFATYADDVSFVFPGANTWAANLRGKPAVEQWVGRYLAVGLHLEPKEILVTGPPWRTRVCVRYTDSYTSPEGVQVYSNSGMFYFEIAWGKVKHYEVHEDTQKVAEFDEYLVTREASEVTAGQPGG
jgi:ketosteroid isomerase-like protein